MFHKALFALFMLGGIVLITSCSPKPSSPKPVATMPNPASVHCGQNGGKLELRKDASGGVVGVCVFSNGSECDEWAFYRQECKPGDSFAASEPTILPATAFPSPKPTAVPATESPSPAPKPTVLRITYFYDGLMLWTEGSGSRKLADADVDQVRISDDGQVVAYLSRNSQGIYEIFAVNADGSNQRLLVGQDYLQNIQPAGQVVSMDFAPASHMLYFVTDQYDLHRIDAPASGSPAPVFGAGEGGFFSFSPDGQWMTLYHPNELVLTRPDGSGAHVVFQYPEDFRYTMVGPQIVWELDSSGFHIASASGPQGSPDSMTVWFIPVTGDPVKQMSYGGPYGANLSPDGRKVVYLYFQHEPIDVHVVAQDGKDTTYNSYSNVNLNFMGWTPDSKHFLLNLSEDGRLAVPYLCAVGEQPIKLTDTDYAYSVNWVDAERFLFVSGDTLRLQRVGESSVLVDTVHASWYDYTYISPLPSSTSPVVQAMEAAADTQWIALIGLDGNVWLVDAVSDEKKQITQDGAPQTVTGTAKQVISYCCFSWSSDGKLLAFGRTDYRETTMDSSVLIYDMERGEAKAMAQDAKSSGLAFRPGTHLLAYDQGLVDPAYFVNGQPDASKARGIFGLDADTGETSELVSPEHGLWLSEPRWSPDGNLLGFSEQTRYEDPAPFALYDFQHKVYNAWNQVIGGYAFAPDGQHIAYDRLSSGGFAGNERIWVSDVWGKDEQGFSPGASPMAHSPAWSPKGDLLAYKLGEPANSPSHVGNILVVQPAEGEPANGEGRRLSIFGYMGPLAWSPDGTRLAFSSGSYDQPQVKVVTVADGSVKDLANGYDPAWQPSYLR